jgi:hypothetical protein
MRRGIPRRNLRRLEKTSVSIVAEEELGTAMIRQEPSSLAESTLMAVGIEIAFTSFFATLSWYA